MVRVFLITQETTISGENGGSVLLTMHCRNILQQISHTLVVPEKVAFEQKLANNRE